MRRNQSGFTLIELLVTMMLMGLLMSIGLPSMMGMVKESRLTSAAYGLVSDLNLARSEAVRTGQRTVFCHSATAGGNQCRTTAATDGWQDTGWLVGLDNDSNQQIDSSPPTNQPDPMRSRENIGTGVKVSPTTASVGAALWFYPDGSVRDSAGRRSEAMFLLCSTDANANGREIEINRAGAVRIEQTENEIQASSC